MTWTQIIQIVGPPLGLALALGFAGIVLLCLLFDKGGAR